MAQLYNIILLQQLHYSLIFLLLGRKVHCVIWVCVEKLLDLLYSVYVRCIPKLLSTAEFYSVGSVGMNNA